MNKPTIGDAGDETHSRVLGRQDGSGRGVRLSRAGDRVLLLEPGHTDRVGGRDAGGGVVFPLLLGGALRPAGCVVSFVDRSASEVLDEIVAVRGSQCEVVPSGPLPGCVTALDPMEAPWTRELVIEADGWSAYLNNFVNGGDSTAIAPAVARRLGARCVVAVHLPRYGPGHAATQLWIFGPEGEPPLQYVRTIDAYCEDGRWSWHETGPAQPFETTERYQARRIRDRFDRALLVDYLGQLGIRVDDPVFFGDGTLVRRTVNWSRRVESVAEFRAANGW